MANLFICGQDGKSAFPNLRQIWEEGARFTVDILGEAVVSEREADEFAARYSRLLANAGPAACISFWSGSTPRVVDAGIGERRREISRPAADIEQGAASRRFAMSAPPEIADHGRGIGRQRAVEPGRVRLLVAEFRQQPHRAPQRRRRAKRSVTATTGNPTDLPARLTSDV